MIKSLSKLPIIDVVIVLLGAMLLNEFYMHAALGDLSIEGFATLANEHARSDNAPLWWKDMMFWVANNSSLFAPIVGPLFVGLSISLILLVVRGITALIAAFVFLIYWVSCWAFPGIWIFEFLFPLLFAICAGLASLIQLIDGPTAQHRILGSKLFGDLKVGWRLLIVLLASVALWYVIILSYNAKEWNTTVAWQSSISFAILFGISALMDTYRPHTDHSPSHHWLSKRLQAISWVDVMILTVAAMMVIQVFADHTIGFYTRHEYVELVQSYAQTTHAPDWFKTFLSWSASYAAILMPLQAIFEALVALLLSLLILRGPVLLLTAGMFMVFTYAEFGVSASWPGGPGTPRTETWELLFVTCAALFISIQQIACLIQAPTWREKWLGRRFFGDLKMVPRVILALLAGAALFYAGLRTHVFGKGYLTTSWQGGISFAILLIINAFLDKIRVKS